MRRLSSIPLGSPVGRESAVPAPRGVAVRRAAWYMLLVVMLLPATVAAATFPRYRTAMQAGREGLPESLLIATDLGTVEYADRGNGPPVLLAHGAGGGFDQGLLIGQTFVGEGYRFIAPSRFGYLRSAIPGNGSPAAQADAYAALLGTLGIERVAIVAISDGGPSALQFALRYPHRTTALVMVAAKSQTPPATSPLQEAVFESVFRSDYGYWAVSTAARPFLLSMLGVSDDIQKQAGSDGQQLIASVVDGMNPIGLRRAGIFHDRATLSVLPLDAFPLEQIVAPTLVVHARDDGLQSYAHGQNTASRVPGARLVSYERGGHALALQIIDIREQVSAFITQHAARVPVPAPVTKP